MGSELKRILKSLCCSHGWSYAVFWSYHQRNSTLLTLEDAYHDEESSTLVDDMLLQVHTFGEGIIGEAALTGNHRWEFQVEHEMLQTLLVVPTASRGVVQLASTKKIPESPEVVDQIIRAFQEIKGCTDQISGTSPSHWDDEMSDLDALFTSLVPLEEPCKVECVQGLSFDELFTPDSSSLLLAPQPYSLTFDISEISETVGDTASSNDSCIDDFGFDILNSYSLDDLHQLLAESPHQNAALFDTAFLQDQPLENCSDDHQEASVVIQGSDKDLFDVLGLNFQDSLACISDSGPTSKGLFSELGIAEFISSSSTVSNPFINSSNSSSSTVSNPFSSVTNQTLSEHFCLNNQTKRRKFETSSSQSSSLFAQSYNNPLIKSETFGKSQSGLRIDERYRWNSKCGPSKKQEEGVKKKRAKAGESTKPRPKDRQMIQDRIKELRGMIPNGAKCSIDALLDLTIKHMLFMQSIAKYAAELKQPYEPKLINQKGSPIEEEVGGERNGATWAFEVGDESVVCPIIVEDLKLPGQMQIEMICEEGGEFLEIADAIKGLGLSILKGVMERREGRMWAHFIVEAKRHVTRLQVFWSLVQLQQQDKDNKDSIINLPDSSQSIPLSFIDSLQ